MLKLIAKHWGAIASVLATFGGFVDWSAVASWGTVHKDSALGIILSAFLTLYYARAPKDKVNQ